MGADIGSDDYALTRVPMAARYAWWSVAVQRFGQLSDLTQFMLGAALGYGMTFVDAFWALTLGTAILEVVAIFVGIAGQKEGLSTTVLGRWTGFGYYGSAVISFIVAVSLIGWFGIQNAVFAEGIHQLVGVLPVWLWSLMTGLAVTVIVIYGFLSMAWTAYITVPAFLFLAGYSVYAALSRHAVGELMTSAPPGPTLSIAAGATIVAGGYMIGAIISPDMTRFNRSTKDVVKQSIISITLGQYPIGLAGVLLAHAAQSDDIIHIVMSTSGALGVLILITATIKINDWNLYSSSLGFVNLMNTLTKRKLHRGFITLMIGTLGSILSALGILDRFVDFLTFLGVTIPALGGIMVVEYFILKRYRKDLEESRAQGVLPEKAENWNPAMVFSWIVASYLGFKLPWGIPSLNTLVLAGMLYYLMMKVLIVKNRKTDFRFRETRI
ncbi:MAG: cytosine permease [Hydrogenibacillus sp.]|nr:cytosine permease [Hydrogenibacillus sp.]